MPWRGAAANAEAMRYPETGSGSAGERVKEKAASLGDEASKRAMQAAEKQKRAGADRMGSVARAVQGAAGDLEHEMPQAAGLMQDAARWLEETSADVSNRSIDDIMGQVRDFARRQPATFFGGALVAGFVVSRFLKSSAPASGETRTKSTTHE